MKGLTLCIAAKPVAAKLVADHGHREGGEPFPERRAVLVSGTLHDGRPRRRLGLRELDLIRRRPLRTYRRGEVAPAAHDAVVVGQELLPVAEVRLERLRLLLGLEAARLAYDGRVEPA